MTVFKCCNVQYELETFNYLRFYRNIKITTTTSLYLTCIITTPDWVFEDTGTTTKDIDLSRGSNLIVFKFKYNGTMPTSSGKYTIAVTFKYYSDAARTMLVAEPDHTFEFHFYHYSDFLSYVYDHVPLDSNFDSDNGNITFVESQLGSVNTPTDWESAIVEGSGCRRGGCTTSGCYWSGWGSSYLRWTISNVPSGKFLTFTHEVLDSYCKDHKICVNDRLDYIDTTPAVYKYYIYTTSLTTLKYDLPKCSSARIDGVYVFNPIS